MSAGSIFHFHKGIDEWIDCEIKGPQLLLDNRLEESCGWMSWLTKWSGIPPIDNSGCLVYRIA